MLQSLKDLEAQFAKYGIPFMCFYGEPQQIIERLIKEWDIRILSFEKDSEAHWKKRDNTVKELCSRHNVQVIEYASHTLYDPDEIFNINNDMAPNTCEELRAFCLKLGDPHKPEPIPDLEFYQKYLVSAMDLYDPVLHKVPDCEHFNIKPECPEQEVVLFEGGETKALQLFKVRLEYEKECFKNGGVNPNLSKPILFNREISLSPYLRFGCLSVRKFYWGVKKVYTKVINYSLNFFNLTYLLSKVINVFLFQKHFSGEKVRYCPAEQLFWREYFYQLSYKNENFAQVDGNRMCYKIPWDYFGKVDQFNLWENVCLNQKIYILICLKTKLRLFSFEFLRVKQDTRGSMLA